MAKNRVVPFRSKTPQQCMHFLAKKGNMCTNQCGDKCAKINADHYQQEVTRYEKLLKAETSRRKLYQRLCYVATITLLIVLITQLYIKFAYAYPS